MNRYTLALPSKGELAEPTEAFLRDAGLKVTRPNPRQYTGSIISLPGIDVLYQRVKDVVYKVSDNTAQIGIAGLDIVHEHGTHDLIVIHDQLNYGHCKLSVAVPEAWVDVQSFVDLIEVAQDLRTTQGRNLRIATTFPLLTRDFFHQQGLHHFTIVKAEGAIEAAPTLGYADAIVDLTQSGTTLRENHLKMLPDGIILESQACLIGNRSALKTSPVLLNLVHQLLDTMDATLNGRQYSQITADIRGDKPAFIAEMVRQNPSTNGLLGPTIAPIYMSDSDEQWHTLQITVTNRDILDAVNFLRSIGAAHVIIAPVRYLFLEMSPTYTSLLQTLGL